MPDVGNIHKKRGAITDRLLNVLQVLQLGKKTGSLAVERDGERGLEQGEIIFAQGQIIQAYGGIWSGQEAFRWLSSWGTCRFLFVPAAPEKTTTPLQLRAPSTTTPLVSNASAALNPAALAKLQQKTLGLHASSFADGAVPCRICTLNVALSMLRRGNMSYSHWHLFLLIDGKKTIAELMYLSEHARKDVFSLLEELGCIGVME